MAWCPFKFKITHFLLVGTTKVVIFSFFMFRFCGGVLDVIYQLQLFLLLHGMSYGLECGLVFVVLT